METIFKETDQCEVEISVYIPAPDASKYFSQATSNVSKVKPINGFRPGLAPFEVVKKTYGNSAILDEFLNIVLKDTFEKAISQKKYPYIGKPKIDIIKLAYGDDFEYKITYPILPNFDIKQYETLKIEPLEEIKVTDKEVEETINYILNSRAKIAKKAKKASFGDYIDINFSAKVGGVTVENGTAENYGFILGKGSFVAGFEKEIEGMGAGEEKSFTLNIPENYPHKQIAGKKTNFVVKVNAVYERTVPELNDEFVKNLGKFTSVSDFKKNIADNILIEKKQKQKEETRHKILTNLRKMFSFNVSPLLVDEEVSNIIYDIKSNIEQSGSSWSDYLKKIGKEEKDLVDGLRETAKEKIQNAIIIEKIAIEKNICPSEEEMTKEINNIIKYYRSPEDAYKDFSVEELKNRVRQNLTQEKVFELLEKIVGYK